jgi:hypothetical protein
VVQRRAVSPSQRLVLENLHEVPAIRFLGSASSTRAHCNLINYFIYVFFLVYVLFFNYVHYARLHQMFDYINGMSFLFEINLMISCLLVYQTCHEIFVNYKFLVIVWIWLYACLSHDPCLGLVKLILYHVNFVTI